MRKQNPDSFRDFDCLWCELDTHKTKDCRKMGRAKEENGTDHDEDNAFPALAYFTARSPLDWFADSGATQHMTYNKLLLRNYKPVVPGDWIVTGIGGTNLAVHGQGDVQFITQIEGIENNVIVPNVAFVPELGTNLFSIVAATEAGMTVSFIDNQVSIHKENSLVFIGERAGRTLYHLQASPKVIVEDLAKAAELLDCTPIAHRRLGHVNMRTIRRMFKKNIVDGLNPRDIETEGNADQCSGCAKGKMHRLVFPDGRRETFLIGEIIHSDVCGPMSYTSMGGARYFVIYKDDFSGFVTIYFMKKKSEVFAYFRLFAALVKKPDRKRHFNT